MNIRRYLPVLVTLLLALSIVAYAILSLPVSSASTNTTLRVVYPDELDESDVTDEFAYQLLASEGIHVITTFYDSPSLAYQALISGQDEIAYDESGGSFGIGGSQQQTTCVGGYMMGGTFLAIAGKGITSPSQLIGKTAEDSGPGTITRYLNQYWLRQANTSFNTNSQSPNSVFLKAGRENYDLVHDIETGVTQEIVVDDFILSDFQNPSVNSTSNGGPYHVLFYSPNNIFDTCYIARDDWLASSINQQILVKFLAALYQAQRIFISDPNAFDTFAGKFLPLSPPAEISYSSMQYPLHFTYWPYGLFNLQGDQNLTGRFQETVNFYVEAGVISAGILNSSVKPYGIVNKYFELKALQTLGPYDYPNQSWVNSTYISEIQSWVPEWMGN